MKKMALLWVCLLCMATTFAQVREGKITFSMKFRSDDPQLQSQMGMFQGAKMIMYFSPDFNRVELTMGGMMNIVTIADVGTKQTLMLMDGMLGKKAFNMPDEDMDEPDLSKPDIRKTGETRTIAGYKCTKYLLTMKEYVMELWTTDALIASKAGMQYINPHIPGYPLKFEAKPIGMVMEFTATEVQKGLGEINKTDLFNMAIPGGYEVVDPNELTGW